MGKKHNAPGLMAQTEGANEAQHRHFISSPRELRALDALLPGAWVSAPIQI